jgi:hypothetical protein
VQAYRDDDLSDDDQVVVEHQSVDRGRDRSLDRVLQRHETLIERGIGHRRQEVGERVAGHGLDVFHGGDGLVGERTLRPEVANPQRSHQ